MAEYEKKVRKILDENGCYFMRHGGRGDHDIWFSPITKRPVTVDGKIPSRHMANVIMKQAGIKYHF
jgi:predicted RNA binding protein YcfA (HicA-like mRNA interferase family)